MQPKTHTAPYDNYENEDIVDYTDCPDCKTTAHIVRSAEGFFANCPYCGRILDEFKDTVEEAVAAFGDRDEVHYN